MKSYIKITRHPYEEPYHLNLVIEASNGRLSGTMEYYDNTESLSHIANNLEVFPKHNTDMFSHEVGSENPEDRFAFYFLFKAFTTNLTGGCAIQLRLNNNRDLPELEVSNFCIQSEASGINRLGKLFREFSKLKLTVLEWDGAKGKVY